MRGEWRARARAPVRSAVVGVTKSGAQRHALAAVFTASTRENIGDHHFAAFYLLFFFRICGAN